MEEQTFRRQEVYNPALRIYTREELRKRKLPQHPYIHRRRDDVARSLCVFYRTTSVSQTWKRLVPFMPVQQSYPAHTHTQTTLLTRIVYIGS